MNQKIIQGNPSQFTKAANAHIQERGIAQELVHVSHANGQVCGVLSDRPRHPSTSGSLIEVRVVSEKEPGKMLAKLQEENPKWQCDAAFPVGDGASPVEEGKKPKFSTIAVFTLRQP